MENIGYLVQRLMNRDLEDQAVELPSFDNFYDVDYMGYAEFEFGAMPASLKRICKDLDEYLPHVVHSIESQVTKEKVRVFCKSDQIDDIERMLQLAAEKEFPDFPTKANYKFFQKIVDNNDRLPDVWWDIENDFFWTIGKQNMNNLQRALKNTKIKFKRENRI